MKRRKKLAYNTVSALLKQIITVICGFILPRYLLLYYGSDVNGAVASITQMLGFITLLEMGIGPVIQTNLYKPLAKGDINKISQIIVSSEKFFRKIAKIFIIYIIVLAGVYPLFINSVFDNIFVISLILIISISIFSQYYFGVTYQLLLNADQKSYIQLNLQSVTILLNTIVSVVLIKHGFSIHFVKLSTAIIYVIRPLFLNAYVKKKYKLNYNITYQEEPIHQKWNGFAQHIAAVVTQNTDIVILTIFSTLKNVSIYSIYFNVVNGITTTIMTSVTGLESLWGNMIANEENELLNKSFDVIEWFLHTMITVLFVTTGILIIPFMKVYTLGVNDTNYILPTFGYILVLSYAIQCLRIPYFRIIKASGHYKETQKGAMISMILNVVISLSLGIRYGLIGTVIGTFVALTYHTIYFVIYLNKNILKRKIFIFIKLLGIDILTSIVVVAVTINLKMGEINYLSWIFLGIKVFIVSLIVSLIINLCFCRKHITTIFTLFMNKRV